MEQSFNILRKNSRLEAFAQIESTWITEQLGLVVKRSHAMELYEYVADWTECDNDNKGQNTEATDVMSCSAEWMHVINSIRVVAYTNTAYQPPVETGQLALHVHVLCHQQRHD